MINKIIELIMPGLVLGLTSHIILRLIMK